MDATPVVATVPRLVAVDCPRCDVQFYAGTSAMHLQILEAGGHRPGTEAELAEWVEQNRQRAIERLEEGCPNHVTAFST